MEMVIQTVGKPRIDEKKVTMVSPRSGLDRGSLCDYTGSWCGTGTLLSIYSPDLVSARKEFLLAMKI